MMTSGRRETSIRGSCDHSRYAENPRRVMLFFIPSFPYWNSPSGLWRGDGIVILCGWFRLRHLGLHQAAGTAVVVKNLRVAAPVHSRIELPLHFLFGEVLVQNVVEKLVIDRMVGLLLQNAV